MRITKYTVHVTTVHGKVVGSLAEIAVADIRRGSTKTKEDEHRVIDVVHVDVALIGRTSIIVYKHIRAT